MYLFVYGDFSDVGEAFEIVGGYSTKEALQNFYKFVGGHRGIDDKLFLDMIRNFPFETCIDVFNALLPQYKIKKVYSGLEEAYIARGAKDGK